MSGEAMSTQREVAPRGLRIQTPLIAFETVYRRTGTLRRTCVFENDTARPIQLRVRYGFREHSWIQLVSEGQDSVEDQLVIEPGATRVHVLMDADSSNFPYDRFRGRVFFDLLFFIVIILLALNILFGIIMNNLNAGVTDFKQLTKVLH